MTIPLVNCRWIFRSSFFYPQTVFSGFIKAKVLTRPCLASWTSHAADFSPVSLATPLHPFLTVSSAPCPSDNTCARADWPDILFSIYTSLLGSHQSGGCTSRAHADDHALWLDPGSPLLSTDIRMPNRSSERQTDLLNSSTSQTSSTLILHVHWVSTPPFTSQAKI